MSGSNEENKKLVAEKSYIPPVGPAGHRLKVRAMSAEDEHLSPESEIVLPDSVKQAYENASSVGFVLEIGPNCWRDQPGKGEPWCKVGDKIAFTRHAGVLLPEEEDGSGEKVTYRVINDLDVYYVYPRNK